jgi:hypothetical protein
MARSPRARISATSGQGVSRLAYKRGHSLAKPPGTPQAKASFENEGGRRDYGKTGKSKYPSGLNVSYGDTLFPTDLKDVQSIADRKPAKPGVSSKQEASKRLK